MYLGPLQRHVAHVTKGNNNTEFEGIDYEGLRRCVVFPAKDCGLVPMAMPDDWEEKGLENRAIPIDEMDFAAHNERVRLKFAKIVEDVGGWRDSDIAMINVESLHPTRDLSNKFNRAGDADTHRRMVELLFWDLTMNVRATAPSGQCVPVVAWALDKQRKNEARLNADAFARVMRAFDGHAFSLYWGAKLDRKAVVAKLMRCLDNWHAYQDGKPSYALIRPERIPSTDDMVWLLELLRWAAVGNVIEWSDTPSLKVQKWDEIWREHEDLYGKNEDAPSGEGDS